MKTGWEVKPLGNLCRIELGSTPARKFAKNWDTDKQTDNVWLSIADLPMGHDPWVSDSKEYVSALAAETIKIVPAGTLMVSFKLTLGRVAIASKDLRTNEAIASMMDLDASLCSRNYLLWYFRCYDWDSAAAGEEKVKGKTLNKAKLKVLPVILPPLEEQQRIVEILDESFAKLETARSNVAANLESSKELFQSVLDESLSGAEENGWETKPLGDLCRIELGSTPARKFPKNWDTDKQTDNVWLTIADLPMGHDPCVSDSKEYVSTLAADAIKTVPAGTLMVSFKLTLGRVAIANKELRTNEAIASMMDLDTSLCSRDFLLWYFRFYDWDSAVAGDVKVKGKTLNKAKLKVLPVILPSLKEQQNIVEKLDSLGEQTDRLQQEYTAQLTDFDELRQSVLQKAFAGELT